MMQKILVVSILMLSGILGFCLSLYQHRNSNLPADLPDVRTVQTSHSPVTFVKQIEGDPHAGEKIFKEFCASCHAKTPIIDIKAPRIGDKKIWKALNQIGIPTLLKITIKGVGAMPSRGGCFECSDEQLRESIQYILKNSI